jgi:hypothetical protein
MNEFKLNKQSKLTTGFRTPEGYFEAVSDKIFEKATRKTSLVSVFRMPTRWKMAAAAILVIGFFVPIYMTLSKDVFEVEAPTIENYIVNNTNINQFDLINELDSEEIENINVNLNLDGENVDAILTSNAKIENLITE